MTPIKGFHIPLSNIPSRLVGLLFEARRKVLRYPPDLRSLVVPDHLETGYLTMLIGMVGATVAPWMQFYLQSAIVEKGVGQKQYAESRVEVIVGCIVMVVVTFFIIVACAATLLLAAISLPSGSCTLTR